jgi:hypothetical protein
MPKLPKKKTEKLAYHKALGETLGKLQAEFRFKHTKKGFIKSLRDHIGKWIDNTNPLELVAVGGMTFLVKYLIDTSEDLRGKLNTLGGLYGEFLTPIGKTKMLTVLGRALGYTEVTPAQFEGMFPDWMDWLISFTIAYVIIKHGGQIFGLASNALGAIQNLSVIIGMLLA